VQGGPAVQEDDAAMSVQFHHRELDNGLTILAETNDQAHTAAVGFFVNTGSRDEDAAVMGVSHFLEHMMFKGTDRRTADDVNREFDEIGANYNAYTGQEATAYFAQVLPEYLPRAIDLLGDMLRPALREDDFTMEKNVILEEISMYEDHPQWRLQDALLETHFEGHGLAHRVLGTRDTIGSLTARQMRGYFDHRYSADNVVVAAAGRLDVDQLVDDVGAVAGHWTPSGAARASTSPTLSSRQHSMADPKIKQHYVAMMCPGPDARDEARYAAHVLAEVIGDSDGSLLYWSLIDPGLAEEADFSHYPQDGVGSFFAFACCDPPRAGEVERLLLETIDTAAQKLSEGDLERVKNKLATQATLQGESPLGRMRGVGHQWLYTGEYRPLDEELRRLRAVTLEDVRGLARQLPQSPRTVVRLGPGERAAS
jgi:predicted Zn-dependent peptidase